MSSSLRLLGAAAALGFWLSLDFLGRTAGGVVHLLPLAALALIFWRVRSPRDARSSQDSEGSA